MGFPASLDLMPYVKVVVDPHLTPMTFREQLDRLLYRQPMGPQMRANLLMLRRQLNVGLELRGFDGYTDEEVEVLSEIEDALAVVEAFMDNRPPFENIGKKYRWP